MRLDHTTGSEDVSLTHLEQGTHDSSDVSSVLEAIRRLDRDLTEAHEKISDLEAENRDLGVRVQELEVYIADVEDRARERGELET